jgi:hypothetical protein
MEKWMVLTLPGLELLLSRLLIEWRTLKRSKINCAWRRELQRRTQQSVRRKGRWTVCFNTHTKYSSREDEYPSTAEGKACLLKSLTQWLIHAEGGAFTFCPLLTYFCWFCFGTLYNGELIRDSWAPFEPCNVSFRVWQRKAWHYMYQYTYNLCKAKHQIGRTHKLLYLLSQLYEKPLEVWKTYIWNTTNATSSFCGTHFSDGTASLSKCLAKKKKKPPLL